MAHWLYPANPKFYDVPGAFAEKDVYWPMNSKVEVGDTVFFYLAAPHKRVAYVGRVDETGLTPAAVRAYTRPYMKAAPDAPSKKSFMRLRVRKRLREESGSPYSLASLKANGLAGALMGPRKLDNAPDLLSHLLKAGR